VTLRHAIVAAVGGLAACFAQVSTAEEWIEDALLHDGRVIEVRREVRYRFGSELRRWPTQFSLRARNPETGAAVRWDGDNGWNPVLLGFHEGKAHLVIAAGLSSVDLKAFGCPAIPYVFLRADTRGHWQQVRPQEWPNHLLQTNLAPFYEKYMMDKGRLRQAEVLGLIASARQSSSGFIGETIPTDFGSWSYGLKNQWRNRPRPGCEHTIPSNVDPSHPQSAGQPAILVELEVLETKVYEPVWVIEGNADIQFSKWNEIAWDSEQAKRCSALVRMVGDETDRPELRGWLVFVKDETRNRKARYPGTMFCDDRWIWMVDYHVPPDTAYTFITKFSHSGELQYRLKFAKPSPPSSGFLGGLLQSRFRAEGGFLYAEWWNTNQSGYSRHVSRAMKMRLKEPGT